MDSNAGTSQQATGNAPFVKTAGDDMKKSLGEFRDNAGGDRNEKKNEDRDDTESEMHKKFMAFWGRGKHARGPSDMYGSENKDYLLAPEFIDEQKFRGAHTEIFMTPRATKPGLYVLATRGTPYTAPLPAATAPTETLRLSVVRHLTAYKEVVTREVLDPVLSIGNASERAMTVAVLLVDNKAVSYAVRLGAVVVNMTTNSLGWAPALQMLDWVFRASSFVPSRDHAGHSASNADWELLAALDGVTFLVVSAYPSFARWWATMGRTVPSARIPVRPRVVVEFSI